MWRRIRDLIIVFFFTLLFATGLKSCIIDAYKIPTGSMIPTLIEGDFLTVNKFIYGARSPQKFFFITIPRIQLPALKKVQRGHVIVFDFPGEPNEVIPVRNLFLVKRCIGLPGDTIEILNGHVIVNGSVMNYFSYAEKDFQRTVIPAKGMMIDINPRNYFQWKVFIQREGSSIAIHNGKIFIDEQETAEYSIQKNYYFMIGDNINSSSDSREWGFVPEENIVGKAMMIYWSLNDDGIQWHRIGTVIR